MVKIKGYDITTPKVRDSHYRRANRFKNNIFECLRALNLTEDDVEVELEKAAHKLIPAKASWWIDGYHLFYDYKGGNYAENLYVVAKVIENEVFQVLKGEKTLQEFMNDFEEEPDMEEERKLAREHLGLEEDCHDLELINKTYKQLAKRAHPDMPEGNVETFKELNRAHKILKRELE